MYDPGMTTTITVAEGAAPGFKFNCTTPDGTEISLTLPNGIAPGSKITLKKDQATGLWTMAEPATSSVSGANPVGSFGTTVVNPVGSFGTTVVNPVGSYGTAAMSAVPVTAMPTTLLTESYTAPPAPVNAYVAPPMPAVVEYTAPPAQYVEVRRPSYTPPPVVEIRRPSYTPPPVSMMPAATVEYSMAPTQVIEVRPQGTQIVTEYAAPPQAVPAAPYVAPPAQVIEVRRPSYTPPPVQFVAGTMTMPATMPAQPPVVVVEQSPAMATMAQGMVALPQTLQTQVVAPSLVETYRPYASPPAVVVEQTRRPSYTPPPVIEVTNLRPSYTPPVIISEMPTAPTVAMPMMQPMGSVQTMQTQAIPMTSPVPGFAMGQQFAQQPPSMGVLPMGPMPGMPGMIPGYGAAPTMPIGSMGMPPMMGKGMPMPMPGAPGWMGGPKGGDWYGKGEFYEFGGKGDQGKGWGKDMGKGGDPAFEPWMDIRGNWHKGKGKGEGKGE